MKQFYGCQLDLVNECLWRDGVRVSLSHKAFAVVSYLVENADRVVTKDELIESVWSGTYVQEENLKLYIWELRRVLGDDSKKPIFIETRSGRGYRFIAPVTEGTSVSAAPAVTTHKQLFGREAELKKLQGWFELAARGERQVIFITGEPGIGKTALAEAFLRQAGADTRFRVLTGQCIESYREQEAYYPVLEALGRLFREPESEPLVQLLAHQAPTWLVQFPSLVTPERRELLQREILGATRDRMLREICGALEALAAQTPIVLELEDLQWTDYSTLDLIAALARRREPARLMLVATYRPVEIILAHHPLKQLKQELQMHGYSQELPLESLNEAAVAEYLAARFYDSPFTRELAGVIHAQTDGNPMFMVTAVDDLVTRGMLRETDGVWKLNAALDRISLIVPDNLRQIIEQQVEQLTAEEQELLAAASIVGIDFSARVVAAGLSSDPYQMESGVEECCERLAKRNLILRSTGLQESPDGEVSGAFQFIHSLYREVIYRRCSSATKLRLHQRIGEALEKQWGGKVAEIASELARHFREGHDYDRAVRYLRLSAENAVQRYAYREAVTILESARDVLGKVAESVRVQQEIDVLSQLARVHSVMGDKLQAARLYETIAERAAVLRRSDVEADALVSLGQELMLVDTLRALAASERAAQISETSKRVRVNAESWAKFFRLALFGWQQSDADAYVEGVEWLRSVGESGYAAQHGPTLAFLRMTAGDYYGALRSSSESLLYSGQEGDSFSALCGHWGMGWSLMHLGRWGESLDALREAIVLAERNGNSLDAAFGRMWIAPLFCEAFDYAGARALSEEALPILRQFPINFAMQRSLIVSATAEMGLENYDGALESLVELRELYNNSAIALSWFWKMPLHCALSELWLARGNVVVAREEAERLRELSDQTVDRAWQARARQVSARVALADGDWKRAENEIGDALAMIDTIEAPLATWRTYETAAQLYELTGRRAQAEEYRQLRNATLLRLANSFDEQEPLRGFVLAAISRDQHIEHAQTCKT